MLRGGMGNDGAVQFLAVSAALAHLEKHDRICAVGNRLIALQAHDAGTLEGVVRLPVLCGRGLLHQQERFSADRTHQIVGHGRPGCRLIPGGIGIPGDDVQSVCPFAVIKRGIESHHVGRDRDAGRGGADRVGFKPAALKEAVRHETPVVEGNGLEGAPPVGEHLAS